MTAIMKTKASILLTEEETASFEAVFDTLVSVLVEDTRFSDIPQSLKWMDKVLRYNVPHGGKLRAKLVAMTYKTIAQNPSKEEMHLAYVLGWCVEMFQGCCLVADDIMDRSTKRRGQPCWYLVDDMGSIALNDAFLLEQALYRVLQKYFKNAKYYPDLVDLFHETLYKTVLGQSLDTHTGRHGNTGEFDMERYKAIVKFKTGYYTIYLPIALAMTLAGLHQNNNKCFKAVEKVSLLIGEFFQVQDDYLDCFGRDRETGKAGTDIQNSKCTWLFVTAKRVCSPDMFAELEKHYGTEDAISVARVKQIYNDIGIPLEYESYKDNMRDRIYIRNSKIESAPVREAFQQLMDILFQE